MKYNKYINLVNNKQNSVLLLHGWGHNAKIWHKLLNYLDYKYHNIYNLNLNNFGDLLKLNHYINNCIGLNLNHNIDIIGWSLGGNIALQLLHKFNYPIKRLFLIATSPYFAYFNKNYFKFVNNFANNPLQTWKYFITLQTIGALNAKTITKQLLDLYHNQLPMPRESLKILLDLLNLDCRNLYNALQCEVINIFAADDQLISPAIITWAESNLKTNIHVLTHTPHVLVYSNPKELMQILNNYHD